jgi:hypothetical protein
LMDQRMERPGSLPTDRKSQEKNVSYFRGHICRIPLSLWKTDPDPALFGDVNKK